MLWIKKYLTKEYRVGTIFVTLYSTPFRLSSSPYVYIYKYRAMHSQRMHLAICILILASMCIQNVRRTWLIQPHAWARTPNTFGMLWLPFGRIAPHASNTREYDDKSGCVCVCLQDLQLSDQNWFRMQHNVIIWLCACNSGAGNYQQVQSNPHSPLNRWCVWPKITGAAACCAGCGGREGDTRGTRLVIRG